MRFDRKKFFLWLKVLVLLGVFIFAGVMTILSQQHHMESLIEVETGNTEEAIMEYNIDYSAFMKNGNQENQSIICFYVDQYAGYLSEEYGVKIGITKTQIAYERSDTGKLQVELKTEEAVDGRLLYVEQGVAYVAVEDVQEKWTLQDSYIATVHFITAKQLYVLPSAALQYDYEMNRSFVYVISDTPKVWGTEYSLKKEYVNVKENNGINAALDHPLYGKPVVKVDETFYDGMLVRLR